MQRQAPALWLPLPKATLEMTATVKLVLLSWTRAAEEGHGRWHRHAFSQPSLRAVSLLHNAREVWTLISTVAKGTGQAKEVGAQSNCLLFLCLSWCYKDLANVLSAENCVFILGFLHYPQPCSARMADLGNLFSAEQIEPYFVFDHHGKNGFSLPSGP